MSADPELEQMMTEEIAEAVRDLRPPVVSAAGLVRAGRREQRRRTGIGAAGLAAVVAAVAVVAVALPGLGRQASPGPTDRPTTFPSLIPPTSPPASAAGLPVGPATDAAWWESGLLHVGDRTYPMASRPRLAYAAGTTLVQENAATFVIRADAAPVRVPARRSDYTGVAPYLSADGRTVAWEGRSGVTAYDVADHRVLGHLPFPAGARFSGSPGDQATFARRVVSVLTDGRVVFVPWTTQDVSAPVEVWTPGESAAIPLDVPGGETNWVSAWPQGMTWGVQIQGQEHSRLARIGSDGELTVAGTSPLFAEGDNGLWNPSGTSFGSENGEVEAPLAPGFGPTMVPLPSGFWEPAGWEDDHHLLLWRVSRHPHTDRAVLVRCSVPQLECKRVAGVAGRGLQFAAPQL